MYNGFMPRGSTPKVYPHDMVSKVESLYREGSTQSEIAFSLGTSQKVIWRLMARHNIKARTAAKRDQRGSNNHMWKSGDASYKAFHQRIQKLRGKPQKCEVCGACGPGRTYDWANLNSRYDDPSDYMRMCRSCHWKHDKKHLNLGAYAQIGGVKCLQNS